MASSNPAAAQAAAQAPELSKLEQDFLLALNRISGLGRDAAQASSAPVPGLDVLTLATWTAIAVKAKTTFAQLEKTLQEAEREKTRYGNLNFSLQGKIHALDRATKALNQAQALTVSHQEQTQQLSQIEGAVNTHDQWIRGLGEDQVRLENAFETQKGRLQGRVNILEGKEYLQQQENEQREEMISEHTRQIESLERGVVQRNARVDKGTDNNTVARNAGKEIFVKGMAGRVAATPNAPRGFITAGTWLDTNFRSFSPTDTTPGSKRKAPSEFLEEGEILEHAPLKAPRPEPTDVELTSLNYTKAQMLKAKQRNSPSAATLEKGFRKMMARIQVSRSGTTVGSRTGSYGQGRIRTPQQGLTVTPQQDQTPPFITIKESHKHLYNALRLPPGWNSKQINQFREDFNEIACRYTARALQEAFDRNTFEPDVRAPGDHHPACLFTVLRGQKGIASIYQYYCKGCQLLKNKFCVYLVYAEGITEKSQHGYDGNDGALDPSSVAGNWKNKFGDRWVVIVRS